MSFVKHGLRRLGHAVVVIWGVTLVTFVVARLLPGNPVYLMVGNQADETTVQEANAKLGFDKPIPEQYFIYMQGLLKGDLGRAWTTSNPVSQDIRQRFPATVELSVIAFIFALLIALPLGITAGLRPRSFVERIAQIVSNFGVAVPQFWLGLMFIYLFYFRLRLMPPPMGRLPLVAAPPHITGLMLVDTLLAGNVDHFWLAAKVLVLPSLTLAMAVQAPILNLVQVSMSAVMKSDAVRTARALGFPRHEVIVRHALRMALLPVLNMIGITFGYLLGGTVLVESVFSWPGMGLYALQAMNASDYAAIQGVVLFSAMIYITVYIALDIAQFVIDPRIR